MKNQKKFYENKWRSEIDDVIGNDYNHYKNKYIESPKFSLIERYIQSIDKPIHSIVEVGCGSGRVLDYFKRKYHINTAWGFDISATAINFARSQHPDCNFEVLDIDRQNLPFHENTIDVVILCDIVEHVQNYTKLISESLRISQNVIIKIPLEKDVMTFLATLLGSKTVYTKQHPHGHIHAFSEKGFLSYLRTSFDNIVIEYEREDDCESKRKFVRLIKKLFYKSSFFPILFGASLGIFIKKTMKNNLFEKVIKNDLCSGCGTCVGVCPSNALSISLGDNQAPVLDEKLCTNCNLCYKVCPGKGYNIREIVEKNPDKGSKFSNEQGFYEYFAHGYSNDDRIRRNSAAGGVATELLKFLITEKKVDKAVVVQLENSKPAVKITDDLSEIEKSQQSKYCPVPLNIALREIMQSDLTYALVGTPCQIAGQYLAEKQIEKLRNKIKYKIGLFCGYIQTFDSIEQVKRSLKIRKDDFDNWELIGWRDGEYPGYFSFKNKVTGEVRRKYLYEGLDFCVPFYSLKRCFLCPDGNNELADLVLGDVHAAGKDENVIICRTKMGDELLKSAQKAGYITYYKINEEKASSGTIGAIVNTKRKNPSYVIEYLKKKNEIVPDFGISFQGSKREKKLAILQFRLIFLLRKQTIKRVLARSPWLMEKIGGYLYRFPGALPGFKLVCFIYRRLLK